MEFILFHFYDKVFCLLCIKFVFCDILAIIVKEFMFFLLEFVYFSVKSKQNLGVHGLKLTIVKVILNVIQL